MKSRYLFSFLVILVTLCFFSACKVGKTYVKPQMDLPQWQDSTQQVADSSSLAYVEWWNIYSDTLLQSLIKTTLDNNKDMLVAAARIEELAALKRVDFSELFPKLDGQVYTELEATDYGGKGFVYDWEPGVKLLARWELDVWGNLRWANEKSKAELLGSIEDRRNLQISLIAQVAQAYFELMALDSELRIVNQTLNARQEGVRLAKVRFEGGLTSETSYQQAQLELARTATLIPDLKGKITKKENEIALLAGEFPHEIQRASMENQIFLPEGLPVGLSSELLERRPDVRAAEQSLIAANAAVGVAYTNMFPKIALTGHFGLESNEFVNFIRSPYGYFLGNLITPLFEMGKNRAMWKAKKAAYEQSRHLYEKQVLVAFKETYDAIVDYNNSQEIYESRLKLEQSAYTTMNLASLQYINGYINYLDVLDAQRTYFDAQLSLNNAILGKQLALIKLYKALGGGW